MVAAIATKAAKLLSVLHDRMTMPLFSFIFPKISRSNGKASTSRGRIRQGSGGSLWGNHRGDPMLCQRQSQPVGVEGPVRQQMSCGKPACQVGHTTQVMGLSRQQSQLHKAAARIGAGDDLGRDAPARPPYGPALRPPLRPDPSGEP